MSSKSRNNIVEAFRYWYGVGKYRLLHSDAHRKYREQISECFAHIEETFVPMRLGKYVHHAPRHPTVETFPKNKINLGKLSFAIVTPSYNQAKFVGDTMQSVIKQRHPDVRYAVMDGGSNDGSQNVIAKYQSKLSAFVSRKDDGQSDAIKKGFELIDGDIMAYLNSDDMLMPGVLAYVENFFHSHNDVDVVYGHRVILDEEGRQIGKWILPNHSDNDLKYFDYIPQETMFWRKRIWEKVGGIDPSFQFAMDWDLILRFIQAGAKFRRLPFFMAYFRAHGSQKSHTIFSTRGEQEIQKILERTHGGEVDRRAYTCIYRSYRRRAAITSLLFDLGIKI